ncbi:MAG: 30S ribosomal protein S21 [Winogradskyella sp.]|jgi:small subunit ribosomal protein S21
MLRIEIKEGEKIERAIKRYRRKYRDTKVKQKIRDKQAYVKPSTKRREQIQKAKYKEQYLLDKEN